MAFGPTVEPAAGEVAREPRETPPRRFPTRAACLTALLLLPLAVMYGETLRLLGRAWWDDPNNSHGLLIPPLAAWFAWRQRAALARLARAPRRLLGFGLALFALLIYFVGRLGVEFFLTRFSLVLLLGALVLYFRGQEHFRLLAFPLFLLLLAIPIPALVFNIVSLPLQALASLTSTSFLQLCGVAVLRDGNVIHLANASLGVAEACSGLRSLMSLIALAVILGYLKWPGWKQRALLVVVSLPLAVLLNIVRIAATALLAEYFDVKYAMGFFHLFSGWLVFILAFLLLLASAKLIDRLLPAAEAQASGEGRSAAVDAGNERPGAAARAGRAGLSYALMAVLLLASAFGAEALTRQAPAAPHKDFASFPLSIGAWSGQRLGDFDAETLAAMGVSDYFNAVYRRGSDQVFLYVGYYRSQRAGESIHSPRNCLPGSGFEVLESARGELDIPALNRRIPVNRYHLQRDAEQLRVLYWYETHGRVIANEYTSKAVLVWEAVHSGRSDGALVRIMAGGPAGRQAAEDFAREAFPALRPFLD